MLACTEQVKNVLRAAENDRNRKWRESLSRPNTAAGSLPLIKPPGTPAFTPTLPARVGSAEVMTARFEEDFLLFECSPNARSLVTTV